MKSKINRRSALKILSASLGMMAFKPKEDVLFPARSEAVGMVRVGVEKISLYEAPSYESSPVGTCFRDQILYIYDHFESDFGPEFNPYWYQVEGGYAHTAYLPKIETQLNEPYSRIDEEGELFEVTVPFTQSYRFHSSYGWQPLYRLYFGSIHRVIGIENGPNGMVWYKLLDDLLKIEYLVPGIHLRHIPLLEYYPLENGTAPEDKLIRVNIREQKLYAYEGEKLVLETSVSTGIPEINGPGEVPSATPRGSFNVSIKVPFRHMGDGAVTSEVDAYELPGVPWVTFFTETGVAFHGTYWHDNFGNEMSHGCVNMRTEEAKWIYRWTTPVVETGEWIAKGYGTRIVVE